MMSLQAGERDHVPSCSKARDPLTLRQMKFSSSLGCSILWLAFQATCRAVDVDLKWVLTRAAHKLAEDLNTTIDYNRLTNGLCFSYKAPGPLDECSEDTRGELLQ